MPRQSKILAICTYTCTCVHNNVYIRTYKILLKLQNNVDALKPKETDSLEPSSPLRQFQKVSKENDKLRKDLKKV